MEINGTDGYKTILKPNSKLEFGRGSGFLADDKTVSRRQVELEHLAVAGEPRVRFLVHGKNPVWVHRRNSGEVVTFKASETGEIGIGDAFCVSAKNPIWFTCKGCETGGEKRENERIELGLEGDLDELNVESVDVSDIDPVKEFGFLVIGEEFNGYPKSMIKDVKTWNWFLEEPRKNGNDNEDDGERKRKKGGGRRKREDNEDEDWTGESEDDKELITRAVKVQKPKYSTRSKDKRGNTASKNAGKKTKSPIPREVATSTNVDEDEDEDEADDETLGGFIVDDKNLEDDEEGEEELDEEEEEEDFDDEEELED